MSGRAALRFRRPGARLLDQRPCWLAALSKRPFARFGEADGRERAKAHFAGLAVRMKRNTHLRATFRRGLPLALVFRTLGRRDDQSTVPVAVLAGLGRFYLPRIQLTHLAGPQIGPQVRRDFGE